MSKPKRALLMETSSKWNNKKIDLNLIVQDVNVLFVFERELWKYDGYLWVPHRAWLNANATVMCGPHRCVERLARSDLQELRTNKRWLNIYAQNSFFARRVVLAKVITSRFAVKGSAQIKNNKIHLFIYSFKFILKSTLALPVLACVSMVVFRVPRSVDPNMISPGRKLSCFSSLPFLHPFDKLNDHLNMISLEK